MSSPSSTLGGRLRAAVLEGATSSFKTAIWLLSIMLPISFGVFLLRWFGVLDWIGTALGPVFQTMGLPGTSGLAFLSGLLINLYSSIAVMGELGLTLREVTILALMGLIAHNFLVELTVMRTTGSHPLRMFLLRIISAVVAAYLLTALLPPSLDDSTPFAQSLVEETGGQESIRTFGNELQGWAFGSLRLVAKLAIILLCLMVGERLLQEFGVVRWLGRRLGPLMRFFGLPREVAFLWVVSNTLGLAYGAGILRKEVEGGRLSQQDGDLLNHHMAVSHSLLEDTLLFVALGVPAFWIVVPRLILALAAVWGRRLERRIRSRLATGSRTRF